MTTGNRRAVLFDVFGTLLDMRDVPHGELLDYGQQLGEFRDTGEYKPLKLPESWAKLPVFPDVQEGLKLLETKYNVYTFSNGPIELTEAALRPAGWLPGYCIDVRDARGYKPVRWIYPWACGMLCMAPADCIMVTANKNFGDLEGATACGMGCVLIRGDSFCPDTIALAKMLGC